MATKRAFKSKQGRLLLQMPAAIALCLNISCSPTFRFLLGDGRGQDIHALAFSPDGTSLAAAGGWDDRTLRRGGLVWVWNTVTGGKVWIVTSGSDANYWLSYAPDGKRLATWDNSGTYTQINATDGSQIMEASRPLPFHIPITLAKRWLTYDGIVDWGKSNSGLMQIVKLHPNLWPVSITASGKLAAFVDTQNDDTIQIWNTKKREFVRKISETGLATTPQSVAFSHNEKMLASEIQGLSDSAMYTIWDIRSGKAITSLKSHSSTGHIIVFSDDDIQAATENYQGLIELWNVKTGKLNCSIRAFGDEH